MKRNRLILIVVVGLTLLAALLLKKKNELEADEFQGFDGGHFRPGAGAGGSW
jgi:hypothetical protein